MKNTFFVFFLQKSEDLGCSFLILPRTCLGHQKPGLSAGKTCVVSAGKTSVVSAAKTSVVSADKTSVVSQDIPTPLPTRPSCGRLRNGVGMSWETSEVLSADTTDVLAADTTDVLPADATHALPADKFGVGNPEFADDFCGF